ncbi:Mu transposase domain-containing protein, partial [Aeromonas caviae]
HYSVPHQYVGQQLELHAGDTLLQVYHQQQLVASHPRNVNQHRKMTRVQRPKLTRVSWLISSSV